MTKKLTSVLKPHDHWIDERTDTADESIVSLRLVLHTEEMGNVPDP